MKKMIKLKKWICLAGYIVGIASAGGCSHLPAFMSEESVVVREEDDRSESASEFADAKKDLETEEGTPGVKTAENIFVHVCGCVNKPGLYELPEGTRAGSAVETAGGFTDDADETAVNLAAVLEDGIQLYVPSKKEAEAGPAASSGTENGMININTAAEDELMMLSGIGESRAAAIVSYREENGSFSSIEDIKNVSGIGEGIFERIKDFITV